MDYAVPLEHSEMRTDGVVRYGKRLSKLLDGASASAQLGDNLPASRREELAVPVHVMKVG